MKINELRPNTNASFRARVLSQGPIKHVKARNISDLEVCSFTLGDDTGTVQYSAFANEIQPLANMIGKVIEISNAWVKYWSGLLQVSKGRSGTWHVVDDPAFVAGNVSETLGQRSYVLSSKTERLETLKNELYRMIWSPKTLRKVRRALKMLQSEKNVMFVHAMGNKIIGVVKSQRSPTKIQYCTRLDEDGEYICHDQDLVQCKGLQGAICKHIMLTMMGIVKENLVDLETLLAWLKKAIFNKPKSQKKEAKEIFEAYEASKGTTDVEWRPVEILPEDFLAF